MLYSIVALLVVIFDQAVKFWVTEHLLGYDEITLIPGLINMVDVANDGAAFGILSGGSARLGFIIVTVIFCIVVIVALATNFINGRLARWSLVMVAAGGFANCIDRVMYGYVVDMFKVVPFNFAIFNVADIFITVFCIIFALAIIFEKDKVDDDDDDDEDEVEDEAEEDDNEPKPRFGKRRRRDEDDEDEVAEPKRPAKLSKKAKAEAEYEEYKAAQDQRLGRKTTAPAQTQAQAPVKTASAAQSNSQTAARANLNSARSDNDPFAEWEQANAKVDAKRSGSYAAQAMDSGVNTSQSRSVYHAPVQQPTQVAEPKQPTAQTSAPAAKPKSGSDEFDLDSILNEFK